MYVVKNGSLGATIDVTPATATTPILFYQTAEMMKPTIDQRMKDEWLKTPQNQIVTGALVLLAGAVGYLYFGK